MRSVVTTSMFLIMSSGVIGNTSDFGSEECEFDPRGDIQSGVNGTVHILGVNDHLKYMRLTISSYRVLNGSSFLYLGTIHVAWLPHLE